MVDQQTQVCEQPQTAMQLIGMILRKMPRQLFKTLPMTLIMGLLGWVLNFWLMAYVNDGFNPDTWLSKNFIPVTGKMLSSIILWGITGAIIPLIINFVRKGGNFGQTIGAVFSQPSAIIAGVQNSNTRFKAILCLALAGTLLVENLLSGVAGLVAGSLLMTSVVAFVTGRDSVLIQLLQMAVNDVKVFILKKPGLRMGDHEIGIIVGACGIAMVIMGISRSIVNLDAVQIIFNAVWLVFFIIGLVLYFSNKPVPKQMVFILAFMGSWFMMHQLDIFTVLADDGGRKEIGGTFIDYINGQGAWEVIIRSFPPAIAIMIGSLIGAIVSSMSGGFQPFQLIPGKRTEDGWDTASESDDYETRLQKYINSLDPSDAKIMFDPVTGTEYRVKYDPVTGESFELNSKRPFSMDQFKEAEKSAAGLDDWRERNAQLEKEYQEKQRQEETARKELNEQLKKLDNLKDKMYKAAEGLDDEFAKEAMYKRIESIVKMQHKFYNGEGDLKLKQAAKMYANALSGKTIGQGELPEDYTFGQSLVDMAKLTGEEIGRGDGFWVGVLQSAVIAAAATVALPAAVAVEGAFIVSKGLYGVNDYVAVGGDSYWGAMVKVATIAVKDEMWGWGFGSAVKGVEAGNAALKSGDNLGTTLKKTWGGASEEMGNNLKNNFLSKKVNGKTDAFKQKLGKAHGDLKTSVSKQKTAGTELAKHENSKNLYKKQAASNRELARQSNIEANQRAQARNKCKEQLKQEAELVNEAKAKADKAADLQTKERYEAQVNEHKKNEQRLENQINENTRLERAARNRAEAAKSAEVKAKDNLGKESSAAKQAKIEYENASEEVKKAKGELDKVVKDNFVENTGKEALKNTVENTETAKNIEKKFNETVLKTFEKDKEV